MPTTSAVFLPLPTPSGATPPGAIASGTTPSGPPAPFPLPRGSRPVGRRGRAPGCSVTPSFAPAVPPRRTVGTFPPVRAGCRGRDRVRSAAVRCRPGVLAAVAVIAAAMIAAPARGAPPARSSGTATSCPAGSEVPR